jgi:hypothetical protein
VNSEIFVAPNFLSVDECYFFISYINNNLQTFDFAPEAKRWQLTLGTDNTKNYVGNDDLDKISEIREKTEDVLDRVRQIANTKYGLNLYTSNLFLAKQSDGAIIPPHYDTDLGENPHCKISGVIYLNRMQKDGGIEFVNFNESFLPGRGDLILFPSDERFTHQVSQISQDRYTIPLFMTEDKNFQLHLKHSS